MLSKLLGVSGKVMWRDTLKLNIIRGIVGGVAWVILGLLMSLFQSVSGEQQIINNSNLLLLPIIPIMFPIFYFGMLLPMCLIIGLIFPIKGVTDTLIVLFILPADPLMFILHKKTNLLPPLQEPYKFLAFSPIIFVYEVAATVFEQDEAVSQDEAASQNNTKPCPFAGKILVDKDTSVMGFNWPTQSTAFTIHDDWKVKDSNGSDFGWIDVDGEIHKGSSAIRGGKVHPNERLAGGNTGVKIKGDKAYQGNDKFGTLVK